jgi:hypothetical protein
VSSGFYFFFQAKYTNATVTAAKTITGQLIDYSPMSPIPIPAGPGTGGMAYF